MFLLFSFFLIFSLFLSPSPLPPDAHLRSLRSAARSSRVALRSHLKRVREQCVLALPLEVRGVVVVVCVCVCCSLDRLCISSRTFCSFSLSISFSLLLSLFLSH